MVRRPHVVTHLAQGERDGGAKGHGQHWHVQAEQEALEEHGTNLRVTVPPEGPDHAPRITSRVGSRTAVAARARTPHAYPSGKKTRRFGGAAASVAGAKKLRMVARVASFSSLDAPNLTGMAPMTLRNCLAIGFDS